MNPIARKQVVAVAQDILSGEVGIVAGARQLSRLRFDVDAENDPDFTFFVGVDSESDNLPLGEVRRHWNPESLRAKDAELEAYETRLRESALAACRNLIQKYET